MTARTACSVPFSPRRLLQAKSPGRTPDPRQRHSEGHTSRFLFFVDNTDQINRRMGSQHRGPPIQKFARASSRNQVSPVYGSTSGSRVPGRTENTASCAC